MPYIEKIEREVINGPINLASEQIQSLGQLNYAITKLVTNYVLSVGISYGVIAGVTGVLANVSTELYRRVWSKYEDHKAATNGDIESLRWMQK